MKMLLATKTHVLFERNLLASSEDSHSHALQSVIVSKDFSSPEAMNSIVSKFNLFLKHAVLLIAKNRTAVIKTSDQTKDG